MAKFEDREKRRKASVVSRIAGPAPETRSRGRGRPKENRETKKRISLTVFPSLYEDIQKIAYMQHRSASDLIGEQLEQFRSAHQQEIFDYESRKKDNPKLPG